MSRRGFFAKACLIASLVPAAASASDGDLDPAFGDAGVAHLNSEMYGSPTVAAGPDGRIVVCDARQNPATLLDDFVLARFMADGAVDASFGTDGSVDLPLDGSANNVCSAIAFQADGKMVFAGARYRAGFGGPDFMIARIDSDGALDDTFADGNGFVELAFGSPYVEGIARAVAIDGEGRIVVAGGAVAGSSTYDFVAARLLADGALDPSFNGTGKFAFASPQTQDVANGLVIDREGRIILAGNLAGGAALIRLRVDGVIDDEFGYHGIVSQPGIGSAESVMIDHADRFVIAGTVYAPGGPSANGDMSAVRVLSDGTLDTTFGLGGVEEIPFDLADDGYGNDHATKVVEEPGGRIVLLGRAEYGDSGYEFYAAAAGLDEEGALDPTFGTGGKITFAFGSSPPDQQGFSGAVAAGGRVLAVSSVGDPDIEHWDDVLIRLENDRVFVDGFE